MKNKLMKSQKKLKKLARKWSHGASKHGDQPVWIAALSAIAGAVTTALVDADKRSQLMEIASDAKQKATDILVPHKSHDGSAKHHHRAHTHSH